MRTEVKNFVVLMIVVLANLVDQRQFDPRSPLNGHRVCGIIFARKFDVTDAQSRVGRIVMKVIVVESKWRLSSRT